MNQNNNQDNNQNTLQNIPNTNLMLLGNGSKTANGVMNIINSGILISNIVISSIIINKKF